MVLRSSRGRPLNAPAAFIHPCQPIVAKQPPSGPGWAHELKHDGYRLQIHVRDGRVRLYTINGADWSKRYPRIVESAALLQGSDVLDAEVVWLDKEGVPNFDALHSRVNDNAANALAFDLLMVNGDDLRRKPYRERKSALRKLLRHDRGIQYVEHAEGHGDKMFAAVCQLGLRALSQRSSTPRINRARQRRG
jgi:bifunctional non-homologous end joining protein LigD